MAPHEGDNLADLMGKYMGSSESSVSKFKKRKKPRHDDEEEDKALIHREVKAAALKKQYR